MGPDQPLRMPIQGASQTERSPLIDGGDVPFGQLTAETIKVANIGKAFSALAAGSALARCRQSIFGHGLIAAARSTHNDRPSSRRLVIVSVGSIPQGSNIDLFDRLTQALRRPNEMAPITSKGLLETSQQSSVLTPATSIK